MSENVNRHAYVGIEQVSGYADRESLLEYRRGRLVKYAPVVDFLVARSAAPISVVEIGSGSSALLYALAQAGRLHQGLGIELSPSRHEFAELWKQDDGVANVTNLNASFDECAMAAATWDWLVVVDNTFTYLAPEDAGYPAQLLRQAFAALKDDGRVLLDFINYARRVPGTDYRQWARYPDTDPYSFGLYSNKIEAGVNHCESIFIKRDGSEWHKREQSQVYPLAELAALLGSCGFVVQEVFAMFDGEAYVESESDRLLVVAGKRALTKDV